MSLPLKHTGVVATPSGAGLSRRMVLAGLLVAPLAACSSIGPQVLSAVGTRVDTKKVDFAMLLSMAHRANDAQLPEAEIRKRWPKTVKVGQLDKYGVNYFIERDDRLRTQHISLPGSHNLKDWLEDFDIHLRPDQRSGVLLHEGFERAALETYSSLKGELRQSYSTYVSGYSMGAGLAAILTAYLLADGYKVHRTVTFGQPRITNAAGAQKFSTLPITRVVNADDLVSMVPTMPFEQFGEEVILHKGPEYVYLSPSDANTISVGEVWREEHRLVLGNHLMDNYIARLTEKLKQATSVPYLAR